MYIYIRICNVFSLYEVSITYCMYYNYLDIFDLQLVQKTYHTLRPGLRRDRGRLSHVRPRHQTLALAP